MKSTLGLAMALAAASLALNSTPTNAQHPKVVVNDNSGFGRMVWQAASEVLHADGSARSTVAKSTQERLEEQFAWFDKRPSGSDVAAPLPDGFLPSSASIHRKHCKLWPVVDYPSPEVYGEALLLLSDVAIIGTVSDIAPGFRGAAPYLLHTLSDVAPLRPGSLIPEYVLAPVGQYVINGRVFCGDPQHNRWSPVLEVGDRIVLVGRWSHGVVWTGPALAYDLAILNEDTGHLKRQTQPQESPATLKLLRDRIDEAVRGGLFDLTAPLLLEESRSPKRREFSETWWNLHQGGCRVTAAAELHDGGWDLTQICGSVERRVVR